MGYEIEFGKYGVRADKDSTDMWNVKATIEKFTKDFTTFVELQERDTVKLEAAIEKQYAANPAAVLNTDAMITLALMEVGFTIHTHQPLKERALEILKDPKSRYVTVKGQNGGRRRLTDEEYAAYKETGKTPMDIERDEKEAEKAAKKAAKAAAKK